MTYRNSHRRQTPDPIDIDGLRPPFAPDDEASEWLFRLRRLGIRPGLTGIRELLTRLDRPDRHMKCVVVAGTNGKGTAATTLAAACQAAGLRTGLYTSPHLLSVSERIVVDGVPIASLALQRLVARHRGMIDELQTTFFESLTGLCLAHFANESVEVAILEAGLGGRLDATNAVDKRAVMLTSIGLDHTELLGDTLTAIAEEKLGLAQAGRPFYLAPLPDDLMRLAHARVLERGGEPIELETLPPVDQSAIGHDSSGQVQRRLAPLVMAGFQDLAVREGWPTTARATDLRVPCRYEAYGVSPRLVLDTAHNTQALTAVLNQWSSEGQRTQRTLVLGLMADKDAEEVFDVAMASSLRVLCAAPRWYRSLSAPVLRDRMRSRAGSDCGIEAYDSVRLALEAARRYAVDGGSVLVTGSNFLVAEALDRLGVDDLWAPPGSTLWDQGLPLRERFPRAQSGEVAV